MATSASAPAPNAQATASADPAAAGDPADASSAADTEDASPAPTIARERRFLALGDMRPFLIDLPTRSAPRMMRIGERHLGMHLVEGFYATVTLQPNRALDPVPPDVSTTDRVLVGVRWMVRF